MFIYIFYEFMCGNLTIFFLGKFTPICVCVHKKYIEILKLGQ